MSTTKLDIACELLDRGLRLYYQGDSYFASLHLGGAAEEILGEYLRRSGRTSTFQSWRTSGVELVNAIHNGDSNWTSEEMGKALNFAKNRTKHFDQSESETASPDPQADATELLERAVSDYYQLMNAYDLPETELISRFNERASRA